MGLSYMNPALHLSVQKISALVAINETLNMTYPHSKVDLLIPLRIFVVVDDLGLFLMSGKADSAVGIDVILVHCSNV